MYNTIELDETLLKYGIKSKNMTIEEINRVLDEIIKNNEKIIKDFQLEINQLENDE